MFLMKDWIKVDLMGDFLEEGTLGG
jgi:hypothetical protein